MIKKVKTALSSEHQIPKQGLTARVVSQAEHGISADDISENARKVLHRLHQGGFDAYLVGGCVRDLLLGKHPKDFDVATNATPEQVKSLFRNCRLIGRRFRLAHILFGRDVIEVATFRGHHQTEQQSTDEILGKQSKEGQILRDNVFGSIEEDAQRRDFTINAMYYSLVDQSIKDFAEGMQAIKSKRIELIGDADTRNREDPVRMLRAVRFAAKLDMQISDSVHESIMRLNGLLANIPPARLFEEVLKLFSAGYGLKTFRLMREYCLVEQLFPQLKGLVSDTDSRETQFIEQVLINTDNRVNTGQRVTPAFLYAAMLWYPIELHAEQLVNEAGLNSHDAFNLAMNDVLHRQLQRIMIPKRFSTSMRDIWHLQQRLPKRFGRRAYQLLDNPKFRAAYDFLLIRAEVEGGSLLDLADWWTEFQTADKSRQQKMLIKLRETEGKPRRYQKRRNKQSAVTPDQP